MKTLQVFILFLLMMLWQTEFPLHDVVVVGRYAFRASEQIYTTLLMANWSRADRPISFARSKLPDEAHVQDMPALSRPC